MDEKKYYYSEIFHSIQGEGHYTGVHTLWLRFFMCNLQCNGFGQINPSDPSTYELPFETYDVSQVKRVEDLPVWDKGCDSSYTWAKKYKHLMGQETPTVLANKIVDALKTDSNPQGKFLHPVTKQRQHLCITGGEPLMITGQSATVGIYEELERQDNLPLSMTFESNGTQKLKQPFIDWVNRIDTEIFFSISPKLWSVAQQETAGEVAKRAFQRGYNVAARVHVYLFGNKIGT